MIFKQTITFLQCSFLTNTSAIQFPDQHFPAMQFPDHHFPAMQFPDYHFPAMQFPDYQQFPAVSLLHAGRIELATPSTGGCLWPQASSPCTKMYNILYDIEKAAMKALRETRSLSVPWLDTNSLVLSDRTWWHSDI